MMRQEREARITARERQVAAIANAAVGTLFLVLVLSAYLSWKLGTQGLDRSFGFWLLFWFSVGGVVKTA